MKSIPTEGPKVSIGSALAHCFTHAVVKGKRRHMAMTVHSDGSGRITIYNTDLSRELASVSLTDEDFRAVRQAIDAHVPRDKKGDDE